MIDVAITRSISSYLFFNTIILAYLIHTLQALLIFSVFYSGFSIATFHLEYSTLQGTSETHEVYLIFKTECKS